MNKKLILAGAVAVVGFISLTAFFDGKTLEQQKAEIAQMVTSKLDVYRTELATACDARVEAEAQTRYAAVVAAREAEAIASGKPGTKKKPTTKGNTTKPLPPATPPAKTNTQDKKDQINQAPNTSEKKDQMEQKPNTNKKKQQMKEAQGGGN